MIKSVMEYCYSTKNNIMITTNGKEKGSGIDCKNIQHWIMIVRTVMKPNKWGGNSNNCCMNISIHESLASTAITKTSYFWS